jgi:hypothetical protein
MQDWNDQNDKDQMDSDMTARQETQSVQPSPEMPLFASTWVALFLTLRRGLVQALSTD